MTNYEESVAARCDKFLSVHVGDQVDEFSTAKCDSCGSHAAGTRHQMTGLLGVGPDAQVFEGVMCTDCALFHANGDLPDYAVEFPSVADVAAELREIRDDLCGLEESDIDVRLQVTTDGWQVWYGDPGYDTTHKGHWGASSIGWEDTDATLRDVAADLIAQTEESAAQR